MAGSHPLISVVIPAYNAARTLHDTVRSALRQTVTDLEVFVVDDGSRDDTLAVAQSIEDPRVRVLTQPNGGASAARNAGLRAAAGRYVAFLDADDLWLPEKLERQLAVLEGPGRPRAVQAGVYFVNDRLEVLSKRPCTDTEDSLAECLQFRNLPAFPTTLVVDREVMLEIGGFDPSLVILEDWDVSIRLARRCGLRSVPCPLALYRVHPSNRSRDVGIHVRPGLMVLERLFADPELPASVRRLRGRAYGSLYRMLAGGYFNQRQYARFARWAVRSLLADPAQVFYMAALPLRRLSRWRSRSGAIGEEIRLLDQSAAPPGTDDTRTAGSPLQQPANR